MSGGPLGAADVSVVIPSGPGWERWDVLQRTLHGLTRQSLAGFETVVAVDSHDSPPAPLGDVRVVAKTGRGPGHRRNAGARAAARPIVLFLGDDTIPAPDLVARHVEEHGRHPEAEVAVLGRVDWDPSVRRGRLERWLDWSRTQFDFPTEAVDDAGFGRFYSSNISLKRSFFLDVGGFDEEFGFGYEDTDLGLRLDHKGLRLRYQPAARCAHLHHYTWPSVKRRFALVGEGEYLMTKKHPGFDPFFLERILNRRRAPWWLPWPWLVELVPDDDAKKSRLRHALESRADAWYYARLTGEFVTGWVITSEADERRQYRHHCHEDAAGAASLGAELPETGRPDAEPGETKLTPTELAETESWSARWLAEVRALVPRGARVLDVGNEARPGSNGLRLFADGYDVSYAGLSEEAAEYLRWRLERRGQASPVHREPLDSVSGKFDAVYASVSTHRGSPSDENPRVEPALEVLEALGSLVILDVTEDKPGASATTDALLERAGARAVRYRRFGRHHLIAYRASSKGLGGAASAVVRRGLGRILPTRRAWYPDPRW